MAQKPKSKASRAEPPAALRLEWIPKEDLSPNPRNWRRHPAGQIQGLKTLLADREVGWAGVVLYNEATGRLIDGHARLEAVPRGTRVPVLVGSWTEEAEKRILASLDPLGGMAVADPEALASLLDEVRLEGPNLEGLRVELDRLMENPAGGDVTPAPALPDGDRSPFQQMTFTLHDDQAGIVCAALAKAQDEGGGESAVNENSNGNALAYICERFIGGDG